MSRVVRADAGGDQWTEVALSLSHDKTRDKKEEFFVLNSLLPSCEIVGVGSG